MPPKVIPKELLEFEGQSPTGGRRLIRFPKYRLVKHLTETGNDPVYEEAYLVPEICDSPTAIWQDLDRKDQEEAFCYYGKPSGNFSRRFGVEIDTTNLVLLVFLTPQLEVTKWRLSDEDKDNPGHPFLDTPDGPRFGAKVWPPDSKNSEHS